MGWGGFQTPVFRYQDTMLGSFIILLSRDLLFVITGYVKGLGALATILWVIAAWILVLNVVPLCIGTKDFSGKLRMGGKLIGISGILFFLDRFTIG